MFKINVAEYDRLIKAVENYEGDVESAINDVLHNEAGTLAQAEIYRLMPMSGKRWKGKKAPAKTSKSLRNINENLAVTITTTKAYQYLYFPDDGSSSRRHAGNQQFFARGGELVQDEIIDRCISRLITKFESEV